MAYVIVANAAGRRWVDDAMAYPRGIPARLRALLDGGIVERDGGTFFASELHPIALEPAALERFVNTVRLDNLKPVQRIAPGSDAWVYECVAIGIALGDAVLALALPSAHSSGDHRGVEVVITVDIGDVEYPDATFRFGTDTGLAPPDDPDTVMVVMRG